MATPPDGLVVNLSLTDQQPESAADQVLAISGGSDMVSVVVRQALVQIEAPDEIGGRVNTVNSMFIGASNQLCEFESGATAALMGPLGSVAAGSIGTLLVAALWLKWFLTLAQRDRISG